MTEPRRRLSRPSKLARNEGRKLFATLLNNVSVALLLAAFVQPVLSMAATGRTFGDMDVFATVAFAGMGAIFGLMAQAVIRRLEE